MAGLIQLLWMGGLVMGTVQLVAAIALKWLLYLVIGLLGLFVLTIAVSLVVRFCARAVYDERMRHLRQMLEPGVADPTLDQKSNKEK